MARRDEIRAKLAQANAPAPPSKVIPIALVAEDYYRLTGRLHLALEGDDAEEVRGEVRKLIERVVFAPLPGKGAFDLKVEGKLARLLGVSEGPGRVRS